MMQFQADLLRCSIYRPKMVETTAAGAAFLAGLAVGLWEDPQEIAKNRSLEQVFAPKMPAEQAQQYLRQWHRAVNRALKWEE
jgi:glycerol kinase